MIASAVENDSPRLDRAGSRRWLVLFVVAVTLAAAAFVVSRPQSSPMSPLVPAAAFSLPPVRDSGDAVSLDAFQGKPMVINFFASWCAPCRRELPALRDASVRFGDRVQFVGIDHQDTRADAVALLDEFGITYPTGFDPKGETAFAYALRGLPATVFVTADGRIEAVRHGELDATSLEQRVKALLAASPTLQRTP